LNEIVSVSMENSAASEKISATIIQISRHIESLVNIASNLSLMAHILEGGFDTSNNFIFIPIHSLNKMTECFRLRVIR